MQATLREARDAHRRRLVRACVLATSAAGFLAVGAVAVFVDPAAAAWAPYLAAPLGAAAAWGLERTGRRAAAVGLIATLAAVVAAQSGVRDATSVGSALYLLPVALFVLAFVDTTRVRRALLAVMLFAAVLQRLLRSAAGLDVSFDAWLEGTFHSVAIFVMFGVLVEVLHHRQAEDRRALERSYDDVAAARSRADAEAAAALTSSRTTSGFLEAMSHELRTPLNAVVGYAELLLDDEPTASVGDDLRRVRDAGMHMVGLVDEVLDVSKVESGRLQRDQGPVDVARMLARTADLARPLLSPGVHLSVEVPEHMGIVVSDRQKLRQILLNLLSNAARFTPKGRIVLSAKREGHDLHLVVQDTGIGMDPARVEGMFEAFAQADHRHGTGLGLALCARFAELLGGAITVDTSLGRGSRFTVTVPVGPGDHDLRSEEAVVPVEASVLDMAPRREANAGNWLRIGSIVGGLFGVVVAGFVMAGLLDSHLGPWPPLALSLASLGAFGLARSGATRPSLAVCVTAAVAMAAYSHGFHPHAQVSVLYLWVIALLVSLVLPPKHLPFVLLTGGATAIAILLLRASQGLDSPDAIASNVIDTVLVYGASSLFLGMSVQRHRHEEEGLVEAAFDLDRLRAQATALAHAATAANTAKSSFLAAMSHELRSPLTAIIGYAELLDDELPPDDDRRDDVNAIERAARTLLALINEVLDLARVQADRMPVSRELLDLRELLQDRQADLKGDGHAVVDRHIFARVVGLLVDRGATTLWLEPGGLHTDVAAGGPHDASLFDPFTVDPIIGRPSAGWALVRELCRAMGGMVAIEDRPGAWRVHLRFPHDQPLAG